MVDVVSDCEHNPTVQLASVSAASPSARRLIYITYSIANGGHAYRNSEHKIETLLNRKIYTLPICVLAQRVIGVSPIPFKY